jgi:hypothetical protein
MRPDFQLFVHVLAATALFGSFGALATFGLAGRGRPERARLATAALVTTFFVAVPSWGLMLVFGSWTKSKEGLPGGISWIDLGSGIASAGIVVLLAVSALGYWWLRRPTGSWQPLVLGLVSTGYLFALGVAWWAMTAKVPS